MDKTTKSNEQLLVLKLYSRKHFETILNRIKAQKDITIEANLIRPLEHIGGALWLRSNGVDKIYKLEERKEISSVNSAQIYLISSNLATFKKVIDHMLKTFNPENFAVEPRYRFHVIVVPTCLEIYNTLLEKNGLCDIATTYSFQWMFLNLDVGCLSLEMPLVFKTEYVYNDLSLIKTISIGLWELFVVFGKPNVMLGFGKRSTIVLDQLDAYVKEYGTLDETSDFEALVIVDRSLDFVSSFLTPVTYSALLTNTFPFRCGVVVLPQTEHDKESSITLDSVNDTIYSKIKEKRFALVPKILHEETKKLLSEETATKNLNLDEMKAYIATKLQQVTQQKKLLSLHLQASERITGEFKHKFVRLQKTEECLLKDKSKSDNIKFLQEFILTEDSRLTVLKLICLASLTQGIGQDDFQSLKLQYLQKFGYNYLYVFDNLIEAGMLLGPPQSKLANLSLSLPNLLPSSNFYQMANKLKLFDTNSEPCPSVVFGGKYIPVVTKILAELLTASSIDEVQNKMEVLGSVTIRGMRSLPLQRKSVLLYVVGGITHAEITACNILEQKYNARIVIASDCVTSGNALIEAAM